MIAEARSTKEDLLAELSYIHLLVHRAGDAIDDETYDTAFELLQNTIKPIFALLGGLHAPDLPIQEKARMISSQIFNERLDHPAGSRIELY